MHPVRIMGIINVSPESFYKESVRTTRRAIRDRAKQAEDEGASYVDVGGMSTAPYLDTMVSMRTESERVQKAVRAIRDGCNLAVSVDTCRAQVAQIAIDEGAAIVNDVTGLQYDPGMALTVKRGGVSVILGAYGGSKTTRAADSKPKEQASVAGKHVAMAARLLEQSLCIAHDAGIPNSRIAIDPSIGFFRFKAAGPFYTRISHDWASRDMAILSGLRIIRSPQQSAPIVISVSNKSFLGRITGRTDAADRAHATIAAETIAAVNGADIIRTHNVAGAKDAVAVASKMRTL